VYLSAVPPVHKYPASHCSSLSLEQRYLRTMTTPPPPPPRTCWLLPKHFGLLRRQSWFRPTNIFEEVAMSVFFDEDGAFCQTPPRLNPPNGDAGHLPLSGSSLESTHLYQVGISTFNNLGVIYQK
jgi:hypothetical protein